MCSAWVGKLAALNAAQGSTELSEPSAATENPVGVCIHALTAMTSTPLATPEIATTTPHHQWTRGDNRFSPYRKSPKKMASKKKA